MSTQFYIAGQRVDWDDYDSWAEVGAGYAAEFFQLVGLPQESCGSIRARDLRIKLKAALSTEIRDFDCGSTVYQDGQGVVSVPRSGAEVLSRRMRELLKLCETAGDLGRINWS